MYLHICINAMIHWSNGINSNWKTKAKFVSSVTLNLYNIVSWSPLWFTTSVFHKAIWLMEIRLRKIFPLLLAHGRFTLQNPSCLLDESSLTHGCLYDHPSDFVIMIRGRLKEKKPAMRNFGRCFTVCYLWPCTLCILLNLLSVNKRCKGIKPLMLQLCRGSAQHGRGFLERMA